MEQISQNMYTNKKDKQYEHANIVLSFALKTTSFRLVETLRCNDNTTYCGSKLLKICDI